MTQKLARSELSTPYSSIHRWASMAKMWGSACVAVDGGKLGGPSYLIASSPDAVGRAPELPHPHAGTPVHGPEYKHVLGDAVVDGLGGLHYGERGEVAASLHGRVEVDLFGGQRMKDLLRSHSVVETVVDASVQVSWVQPCVPCRRPGQP